MVEEVEKKNAKLNKHKKSKKKKVYVPVETVRQQYRSSNHLHRAVIFHSTFQHEHMCHRVTEAEGGWCWSRGRAARAESGWIEQTMGG